MNQFQLNHESRQPLFIKTLTAPSKGMFRVQAKKSFSSKRNIKFIKDFQNNNPLTNSIFNPVTTTNAEHTNKNISKSKFFQQLIKDVNKNKYLSRSTVPEQLKPTKLCPNLIALQKKISWLQNNKNLIKNAHKYQAPEFVFSKRSIKWNDTSFMENLKCYTNQKVQSRSESTVVREQVNKQQNSVQNLEQNTWYYRAFTQQNNHQKYDSSTPKQLSPKNFQKWTLSYRERAGKRAQSSRQRQEVEFKKRSASYDVRYI